jgi:hypothetical protein
MDGITGTLKKAIRTHTHTADFGLIAHSPEYVCSGRFSCFCNSLMSVSKKALKKMSGKRF